MKTFYIALQLEKDVKITETITGTLADARKALSSDAYDDGTYRILEDTSGVITKKSETVKKSSITFDVPAGRKRPRKTSE